MTSNRWSDQWRIELDYPAIWSIDNDNRMSFDINYRAFPVIRLVLTRVAGFSGFGGTGICGTHAKAHVEFEHHEQRSTIFDASEHNEDQGIPDRVGRSIAYAILTCDNIDTNRIPDWAKEPTARFLEIHERRIHRTKASMMTTHLEDKPKSGCYREDGFAWRYTTLCGETFIRGGPKHRIAEPGATPTCEGCKAAQRDKVMP